MHIYTAEEAQFLADNICGRSMKDLWTLFNAHFGLDLSINQIHAACSNRHLRNGLDGRIRPGTIPPNKGVKGIHCSPSTEFKKGSIPVNHRIVGSTRVDVDGYTWVKVLEPNKWQLLHRIIWEEKHGTIPPRHAVIFSDGNRGNLDIDNLLLISQEELAVMNKNHLFSDNRELTEAGKLIADIKMISSDRLRKDGMKHGR
jgi:hypothetical protein